MSASNIFFRVIVTVLQIIFYSVSATLSLFPLLSTQSLPLIILRAVSILVFIVLPTFTRALLKDDMAFVMFHFTMLNLTIFSSFLIYYELPLLSIHICTNNFIDVVPQPLTGPVIGISLIVVPAIFLLVESVFHGIITNPYSDDLGYYGRFHRGLWAALGGLFFCCGGGGEDLGSAQPAQPIQPGPPPYSVSALPSISFAAHQDHITKYALAADTAKVLGDDGKIV